MDTIGFSHPDLFPYVSAGVVVSLVISLVWLIRRTGYIRFYGRKGGRIHGQFRVSCYIAGVVLAGLGLGLSLTEPYVRKEIPYDVFEPTYIVTALDISKSMLASSESAPCSPARLDLAVRAIANLIEAVGHRNSDKMALVVFARRAYPAVPVPTDDYELIKLRLEKETSFENILSMPEGTNQWDAVERALQIFSPMEKYRKVLIIITDGDPDAPREVIEKSKREALRTKSRMDVDAFVIGVGEPDMRLSIPLERLAGGCPDENKGFMIQTAGFDKGQVMTTVVDTDQLSGLSKDLGGDYIHTESGIELAEEMVHIIESKRIRTGTKYETSYIDLSVYVIEGVLFMLAVLAILRTP